MKKLSLLLVCATAGASGVFAHPTTIAYDTRGECESASAQYSNDERRHRKADGTQDPDDANRFFHETFDCEKNPNDGKWYIVDQRL